jgi:hypothetical protein
LVDVDGGHRRCLIPANGQEYPDNFCISPDGKFLAVVFAEFQSGADGKPAPSSLRSQLAIVDIDGRGRKSIAMAHDYMRLLDWRRQQE